MGPALVVDPHEKRAGVCFDESGSHGETPKFLLICSRNENASSLKLPVRKPTVGRTVCVCVFNVVCIAAYQLLIEMLTILGTG